MCYCRKTLNYAVQARPERAAIVLVKVVIVDSKGSSDDAASIKADVYSLMNEFIIENS